MLQGVNPSFYDFPEPQFLNFNPIPYSTLTEDALYSSDEFRMYAFKVKRCTKSRSHDWTDCPFAHRGEKARRRDPRKFNYVAIACPDFRYGNCPKGESCEFAHGVFEYWLHPARYRTRACNAGRFCQRKVCFFAHTPEQLRSETKYKCHYAYRARMCGSNGGNGLVEDGSGGLENATPALPLGSGGKSVSDWAGDSVFLKSLGGLKIGGVEDGERSLGGDMTSDLDLPHIGWISELVE